MHVPSLIDLVRSATRNWQSRVRLGLAVFTIVFAVAVFLAIGTRQEPPVQGAVERADPNAVIESTGATVTQAKGTRQDFKVEAARQLTYAGGKTKLETVRITVAERAGRNFEVTGREAEIGENQSKITVTGDVRMAVSDGLTARTEAATYDDGEGMVHVPGRVEFARERMSGSGVGANYDRTRDILSLLDQARVMMTPDAAGIGGLDIAAGAAALARPEGYARFERSVRALRAGQIIEADNAMAHFSAGGLQRIELLELRGGARITGAEGVSRSPGMTATDIDLAYAGPAQALSRAVLAGNAQVELAGGAGGAGAGGRRISADSIEIRFAADGTTIAGIAARERVQLEFGAEPDAPARRVLARSMEGHGDGQNGITNLSLADAVEYRETSVAEGQSLERTVTARMLDLTVQPGLGRVEEARFAGDVQLAEGQLRAEAPLARYRLLKGNVELTRPAAGAGRRPVVIDDAATIEAHAIDLTLEGRKLIADGDVRTVLQPSGQRSPSEAPRNAEMKRPAILKSDTPVYVTGRHLVYDGGSRHAVYTGDARLWQGQTAVQGERVVLDEEKGNLSATGSVRTTLMFEQKGAEQTTKQTVNSVATANDFLYEDGLRRATYLGSGDASRPPARSVPAPDAKPTVASAPALGAAPAGAAADGAAPQRAVAPASSAHVSGPQGDLTAAKIELFLDAAGSGLERVEAYENVTLRSQGTAGTSRVARPRTATGTRMTYFTADERYVMSGTPVAIIEECRETTGKSLTFYKSADTISVDGNEEIRTQTKAGEKCPEL